MNRYLLPIKEFSQLKKKALKRNLHVSMKYPSDEYRVQILL